MYSKQNDNIDYIIFYYPKQDIFSYIEKNTIYRARNIKDDKGVPLIDDFALSDDEKDLFEAFAKKAIFELSGMVSKLTKGLYDVVISDGDVLLTNQDGTTTTIPHCYAIKITDSHGYNENILPEIDYALFDFIISSVMEQWYHSTGIDEEWQKWTLKHQNNIDDLRVNRLFQLRKPKVNV